jgi:hypothetical protein
MAKDILAGLKFDDETVYVAIKGKTLNALLRVVRESRFLGGPGINTRQTHDGVEASIESAASASACEFAFKVRKSKTTGKVTVGDGTLAGITPNMGGIALNQYPPPEISLADGASLFFKIAVKPNASNFGTQAHPRYGASGGSVTSVDVIASTNDPLGNDASVNIQSGAKQNGIYYRRIITWHGSESCSQPLKGSLSAVCCGNGDSDGQSLLRLTLGPESLP